MWTDARDRRTFFDRIAITEGFDPLIPRNWYNITYSTLKRYKVYYPPLPLPSASLRPFTLNMQGYKMIVHHYHGGKLAECLMQLYPDIDLKKSKFMKCTYPSPLSFLSLLSLLSFLHVLSFLFSTPIRYNLILFYFCIDEQQRRRELLEKFARTKGGNPHDPHFWYTLNPADFRTVKVCLFFPHILSFVPFFLFFVLSLNDDN